MKRVLLLLPTTSYRNDDFLAAAKKLGVEIVPYARLFGADGNTVYFQHAASGEPIVLEGVDTLVTSYGQDRVAELETELEGLNIETHLIGDCATPRTAEEAVLEGLKIAAAL